MAVPSVTQVALAQPGTGGAPPTLCAPSPTTNIPSASSASAGTGGSSSGSSEASDSDDIVYHFGNMKVDRKWAEKVMQAGYADMDELGEKLLEDAHFVDLARELQIPSGVKTKMVKGVTSFLNGTFDIDYALPRQDFNRNAPRQSTAGFNWKFWGAIVVGGLVVGGAIGYFLWAASSAVAVGAAAEGGAAVAGAGAGAAAQGGAAAAGAGAGAGGGAAAAGAGAGVGGGAAGVVGGAIILVILSDCVDGEAEITLDNRKKKKIKDIQIGDMILSVNKGKKKIRKVMEVKKGRSSNMRKITLKDARDRFFSIRATGGHPFYTIDNTWAVLDPAQAKFNNPAPVPQLRVGDRLVLANGKAVEVTSISHVLEAMDTYNLVLDGPGTFFVNDVLSHSGLPPSKN